MVRFMKFEQILCLLSLLIEIILTVNIIIISQGNKFHEGGLNALFINFFIMNSMIGLAYSVILWRTYPINQGKNQYILSILMLLKICCLIGTADSKKWNIPLMNTILGIHFQSSLLARSVNRPYILEGIFCSIFAITTQSIEYTIGEFPQSHSEINVWCGISMLGLICFGNIWLDNNEDPIQKLLEKQISRLPDIDLNQNQIEEVKENNIKRLSQAEEIENEKNNLSQGTQINDDEAILKHYSWIKKLQFIVFDLDLNIILQTFSLDLFLSNQNMSQLNASDHEQVQTILKQHIVSCNYELYKVCEENSEAQTSKSSFTYNEEKHFFPSTPLSLENLMTKILLDYNKYKQSVFQIYKLDSQQPEMQVTNLKLFMSQLQNKPFVFIQFKKNEKIQLQPANQNSILRLFRSMQSTYIDQVALYLNCVTTLSALAEYDTTIDSYIQDLYISPIRNSATEMYLQVANTRDYNLFLQNQLIYRITQIRIQDTISDVAGLLNEAFDAKGITIRLEINDTEETQNMIYSDPERIRQLLYILLKRSLNQVSHGQIVIQLTQMNSISVSVLITDCGSGMNTKELRQMINQINKYSFSQSVAALEVTTRGLSEYQDLVIAQVIARKLSGSYRRGIDITSEKHKGTQYFFILETQIQSMEQSPENSAIKVLTNQRYFETSLSYLLGQQQSDYSKFASSVSKFPESNHILSKEKSLQFSLSMISRQPSQFKQDQVSSVYQTGKGQDSAHSKVQNNSFVLTNPLNNTIYPIMLGSKRSVGNNLIGKQFGSEPDANTSQRKGSNFSLKPPSQVKVSKIDEEEISFNKDSNLSVINLSKRCPPSFESQQMFKNNIKLVLDGTSVSGIPLLQTSHLDMGTDTILSLKIPQSEKPKFFGQILRYKINSKCCTKVLIAGHEFASMRMIEVILTFYQIKSDHAFSNEQAFKLIDQKQQNTCRCGNKSYLLYFVDFALPPRGGLFFSKNIRDSINQNQLDNAVIIGTTGITSLDLKMECFKNGMDHYFGLPIDLSQFHQIMRFFLEELQ